jgi:Mg2+/Co2+ transporter CorB
MFIGIVIILLVVSALVAGGRVAFVAAAFDALFREIQEEEARKRKKKKVQIKEKSTLKSTYPGKKKK